MLEVLYAPAERATARDTVPLGTWVATTDASTSGDPSRSVTNPLMSAVVTPCPNNAEGNNRDAPNTSTSRVGSRSLGAFTTSSLTEVRLRRVSRHDVGKRLPGTARHGPAQAETEAVG